MKQPAFIFVAVAACLYAGDKEKAKTSPPPDMSRIPAEVHAPIFRGPQPNQAGALTDRLAAGLAKPTSPSSVARRNFIDDRIFTRMEREGIPHAPLATDHEFFRRVTLDLTGRIPSPADLREFLADTSPDKRARLIERLVGSPAWVDKWAYFLMDTFRAN